MRATTLPPEGNERPHEPAAQGFQARSPARISVVIVDEEDLGRVLLVAALSGTGNIDIVGAFSDAETAIDAVRRLRPQVVVMEIELPGPLNGIQAGLVLRREFPEIGIVWLSSYKRPYIPLSFQLTTGWAYLLKTSGTDVRSLAAAIDGVANGFVVLDPGIATTMSRLRGAWVPRLSVLEYDILALTAQGLSNAAIARALNLSEQSVRRHINQIYRHLGLGRPGAVKQRRVQAVVTFLRAGETPALAVEPQVEPTDTRAELERRREQVENMPARPVLDHSTFVERVHEEIARCLRTRRHLSLVLLTVPPLDATAPQGPVPDPHTLRRIAGELTRHVRRYDLVAVSGDVEVVLMFPEATRDSTGIILDRLRAAAAGAAPRETPPLWGLATWPADGTDPGALLETARGRLATT